MDCPAAYSKANNDCDEMCNIFPKNTKCVGSLCIASAKVTAAFLGVTAVGVTAFCFPNPCLCKTALFSGIVTQGPIVGMCAVNIAAEFFKNQRDNVGTS